MVGPSRDEPPIPVTKPSHLKNPFLLANPIHPGDMEAGDRSAPSTRYEIVADSNSFAGRWQTRGHSNPLSTPLTYAHMRIFPGEPYYPSALAPEQIAAFHLSPSDSTGESCGSTPRSNENCSIRIHLRVDSWHLSQCLTGRRGLIELVCLQKTP